jgi:hypothetical protein
MDDGMEMVLYCGFAVPLVACGCFVHGEYFHH